MNPTKKKSFQVIGGLAAIVICFAAGWLGGQSVSVLPTAPTAAPIAAQEPATSEEAAVVRLMFDFGDGTIKTVNDFAIPRVGASLFDVMAAMQEQGKIRLDYQDYGGGLGVFLKGIDGVPGKSVTDQWWQFWINNEYSQAGVSAYHPKSGDIIEFKFVKGQMPAP